MVAFFYQGAVARASERWRVCRMLVVCRVAVLAALVSSCYSIDEDADDSTFADRREAQAYIMSSYNKMAENLPRSDFAAIDRLGSISDEYRWDDKEASIKRAEAYASKVLRGNVSVLRDVLSFCESNSGVYEADGGKVFHKVADAERRLTVAFSKDVSLSFAWDMAEKNAEKTVMDLEFSFNRYTIAGQSRVYRDSVVSSYRMMRGDITLARIERLVKGEHILDAVNGVDGVEMKVLLSDLRLQLMDMMCLHKTDNDVSTIIDYVLDNYLLQVEDPKAFLDGFMERVNNLNRVVLTRPNGAALCRITYDMLSDDNGERLCPVLHWGDGSEQTLYEFASASANEAFAKDADMLERLWRRLYELYGLDVE